MKQIPLKWNWWLKNRYFQAYMLREATVLPLLLFVLNLLAGLWALRQGEAQWQAWLAWQLQPVMVLLHLLTLAASLFHAWTLFVLLPRVLPLYLGGRQISARVMVAVQCSLPVLAALLLWLWVQ